MYIPLPPPPQISQNDGIMIEDMYRLLGGGVLTPVFKIESQGGDRSQLKK